MGYRTKLSMLNNYTWRYANRVCSMILLSGGGVLAVELLALNLAMAHYVVFLSVFLHYVSFDSHSLRGA